MLFSEKCADPDEKSYYACGNSSRPSLFAKVPLLGDSAKGKQTPYTQHISLCSYCAYRNSVNTAFLRLFRYVRTDRTMTIRI